MIRPNSDPRTLKIGEVLAKLDTIPPVTMVEVAPVDLAGFDQLCTQMGVRQ